MTALIALAALAQVYPSTKGSIDLATGDFLVVGLTETCPHGLKHGPTLGRLARALAPKVKLVAVMARQPEVARAYARKTKAGFPIIADPEGKLVALAQAEHVLDMAYFRQGKLIARREGLSRANLAALLDEARTPVAKSLAFLPSGAASGCSMGG